MSIERFVATSATAGTAESRWAASDMCLRHFSLAGCERMVVVAPHPDDEVLGVGAIASSAAELGIDCHTIVVTDGQSSHPGSPTYTPAQLSALRRTESALAGRILGLTRPTYLGFVDGRLASSERALSQALSRYVADAWVLVTWTHDGHADHEACARATRRACEDAGARLLEYPIWMWHWAEPNDPDVPWKRARRFELSAAAARRKERAVGAFASQIYPLSEHPADAAILPPHILKRLLRPYEIVFVPEVETV